ncbi:MAG: T9SS type A sorting domain-containing protein [Lentimicrobium sp.]|nr:T9SS type A sorting domain-containing protein [Lentimicrobium sp.]
MHISPVRMIFFTWMALFFIRINPLLAQPNFPDDGEVFRDDVVPKIDIYIHPDTLQWIYNNPHSNIEWRASFVFDNGNIHDSIVEVGFRLRGNTSRQSAKKSFKVSFNTYQKGRKYYGLEKMNLNGEHNDPSVTRAKLCWDLARSLEIPAPRSNHVRVFINGNYFGLYLNVEHIDDEFVQSRYGTQYGNLYKCLYPADLKYLGTNPNLYKYESGGRRAYDLKTNRAYDDYTDLSEFIQILNNTPIGLLPCELERVFNVQDYIKVLAFDVFIANWDGYIYNKNNFYLYKNPESGRFEYIPYDLDNTFGVDWANIDWANRNIYYWAPSNQQSEPRPLYTRLMSVQRYKDLFSFYLNKIAQEILIQPDYYTYMDDIRDRIYPYIIDDPYYPLDYGFNTDTFLEAYDNAWGNHVKYGIKPYFTTRLNSLQQQIQLNPIYPVINYIQVEHGGVGSPVNFSLTVWDDQPEVQVWLRYRFNQSEFVTMPMTPLQNDKFEATLDGVLGQVTLRYHFQVKDASGNFIFYPCETEELYFAPLYTSGLYINEFMASNASTIFDENGEFDDWIELYNAGPEAIWLGDKYLSDKLNNPTKWQMPDHAIFPGDYLIIWADGDMEQGPFHAGFKLSADGESIGIFNNEQNNYSAIDTYTFSSQQTDVSFGRSPDGNSMWVFFDEPTPGSSNIVYTINDNMNSASGFFVYPNPAKSNIIHLPNKKSFYIYDTSGRLLIEGKGKDFIDVSTLDRGVYLLKTFENDIVKIIIQ